MRDLAILTFLTLDGVMQAPRFPEEDPSDGFTHGGWAVNCWDEVMEQVRREATAAPYDILFGRKTYESFAAHWPHVGDDNPDAKKMNNATKFVATSTLSKLEWKNAKPITGDIAAEVARLKDQDGLLLQVHGSWQLVQTLLAHELIDEFRLWTFPVVVGSGKRPPTSRAKRRTDCSELPNLRCPTGHHKSTFVVNTSKACGCEQWTSIVATTDRLMTPPAWCSLRPARSGTALRSKTLPATCWLLRNLGVGVGTCCDFRPAYA